MRKSGIDLDPEALERAAQYIREIERSPHAREALIAMIKEGEVKKARYEAKAKEREIERIQKEAEEKRKNMDKQLDNAKKQTEYNDQLSRNRHKDQLKEQEKFQEQLRREQEQSLKRQEEIRRETITHEYQKKLDYEEKRLEKKGKMLAKIKRETHDLEQADIILREEEKRKTYSQIFTVGMDRFGKGLWNFLSDRDIIMNCALLTGLVGGSLYFSKYFFGMASRMIEARFAKPSLVRETSRPTFRQFYKYPMRMWDSIPFRLRDPTKEIFSGVIFNPSLERQLEVITYGIINRKKNLAPFRNMLFHGPPGTGKTLFAKKLALNSGMDYAILTGADIAPLGKDGVSELHKVFDWSNTSRRGMILFIDEADAFFRKREHGDTMSEDLRNAINAYLYRTGSPSKKFMFVLATNMPEVLDKAIHDRVDQAIYFGVPGKEEREELLYYYLVKYCSPKYNWKEMLRDVYHAPFSIFYRKVFMKMENITDADVKSIADQTEGFSAREIEKFVINCHSIAFSQENPVLTLDIMNGALGKALEQHKQRKDWEKDHRKLAESNVVQST